MKYCKNYCEEEGISTSKLNEAQRTLYYIAENMKMDKSISEEGYKHFQIAIKALEQEPCEDAISRQAVMDCFKKWQPYMATRLHEFEKELSELPSVAIPSAEPKTGHWIIIDDCEKFIAKCSECGQIEDSRMIGKYAYCHCGARMVEPQEGSKE